VGQKNLSASETFLKPVLAFIREWSITGCMAILDDRLRDVEQFLADNERLVEWDIKGFHGLPPGGDA
jgi:hypothetical protein